MVATHSPNVFRVSYVYVKGPLQARGHEKTEEAMYALGQGLPLDLPYYLNHQACRNTTQATCRVPHYLTPHSAIFSR